MYLFFFKWKNNKRTKKPFSKNTTLTDLKKNPTKTMKVQQYKTKATTAPTGINITVA